VNAAPDLPIGVRPEFAIPANASSGLGIDDLAIIIPFRVEISP
jgi:hypothetical protein